MRVYAILSPPQPSEGAEALANAVRTLEENNRIEVTDGVWFIRTPLETAVQVKAALGIDPAQHCGIVLEIAGQVGVADSDLATRIRAWNF